jgi:hypothetical protein
MKTTDLAQTARMCTCVHACVSDKREMAGSVVAIAILFLTVRSVTLI